MGFDGVSGTLTVAAVQGTPVFLDRSRTLEVAAAHVARADSELVVFSESFVPGYPDWVWRRAPMSGDEWYARLVANAVRADSADLDPLRDAARDTGSWVALGVTERCDSDTLYNSVVYIDAEGQIAARHRKLVPTGAERLVWGNGNDHLLTVVEIHGVRVGSLICWENYMPLARTAMYERGIDVLLAPTWDSVTAFLRGSDVPRDLPGAKESYGGDEDFMSRGNTTIVAPGGEVLAGPLIGAAGVVTATLDMSRIATGRRIFDPTGHYARPDVLSLRQPDWE